MQHITEQSLAAFADWLTQQEKSPVTVRKYLRDLRAFAAFAGAEPLTKALTVAYKNQLTRRSAPASVNSRLSALNSFLHFLGAEECRVRLLKQQQKIYCPAERALTERDYAKLLNCSAGRTRLLLQTLCGTGIRVSELQYFTVEAVQHNAVTVRCKGKSREILIPSALRTELLRYARKKGITEGIIFRTRSGRPLDRSNIWKMLKALCGKAKVAAAKVFPHNFRKLFARQFHKANKDIALLADVLGHSSINTTRIYLMTTFREHQAKIDRLGLIDIPIPDAEI